MFYGFAKADLVMLIMSSFRLLTSPKFYISTSLSLTLIFGILFLTRSLFEYIFTKFDRLLIQAN